MDSDRPASAPEPREPAVAADAHAPSGSGRMAVDGGGPIVMNVLMVDDDAAFVERVQASMAAEQPAWRWKFAGSAGAARAVLAAATRAFDAVVVRHRLADGTAFDLMGQCAPETLLLGLEPGEEAVAARALRLGVADTFVRDSRSATGALALAAQLERLTQRRCQRKERAQETYRLAQKKLLLGAISRAHARFLSSPRPADAFESLLQDFLAITQSRFGFIAEVVTDADGGPSLRARALSGISRDDAIRHFLAEHGEEGLPLANPQSLFDAGLRTGKPVIANQIAGDASAGGLPAGYPPIDTFLGLPVHAQDRLVAMVGLANRAGGYTQADVDFLEPMAATVGQLVEARRSLLERARDAERLRQSETRWRSIADLSSDWYWEQDADYRLTRLEGDIGRNNPVGAEHLRIGMRRWELPVVNLTEAEWSAHRAVCVAHQPFRDFEMQFSGKGGATSWVSVSGVPVFDDAGNFTGYRGMGRDITAHKRTELYIEWLAYVDDLTGLPNRRRLVERLMQAQDGSARSGRHAALLLLDLDHFHDVNDALGPERSDDVLKMVAQRLRTCVQPGDTLARFGGDEFILLREGLAQDVTSAHAQAEATALAIQQALSPPYVAGDAELVSTCSMGIVVFLDNICTVNELLQRGDLAMYQAKAAGRNSYRFFAPAMHETLLTSQRLEADLRKAVAAGELRVHYQPIVGSDRRAVGVEALVRWNHPVRGFIPPDQFIPAAEQSGLIVAIGHFVLKTACAQLAAWADVPATRMLSISVNVSVREFHQPGFADGVLAALRRSGADPRLLKLEVTESLLMEDVPATVAVMQQLQAEGVGWSLDDFGTGFSSLSYLKRLPVERLKIDQSFVRGLMTDAHDRAIARTLIELAASFHITVVAEGVETTEQHAFLEANGCQFFQGYLYGRPAPVEQLDGLLGTHPAQN